MNLIKISEDLKDLPLQAIQAYMNGLNPEVPPYLAQAEMMRRQKLMEKQQMQEGAQGAQPSVKEQLEQAAGLMSLQQQREQQGFKQVAQQSQQQPMPTDPNVPQPEAQPEAAGVAGLPIPDSMFAMAGGGVVGYAAGGDVRPTKEPGESEIEYRKRLLAWEFERGDRMFGPRPAPMAAGSAENRTALNAAESRMAKQPPQPPQAGLPAALSPRPQQPQSRPPQMTPQQMEQNVAPPAPPEPQAPPMAQPPQSPEGLARDILMQQLKAPDVQYTPEMAGQVDQKIAEQSGLAALEKRRAAMERQYADITNDRPFETFLAAMRGGAQGPGGLTDAYLAAKGAQRQADTAFAQQMYGLAKGPADTQYQQQHALYQRGTGETDKARDDKRQAAKAILEPIASRSAGSADERVFREVQALRAQGKYAEAEQLIKEWQAVKNQPKDKPPVSEDIMKVLLQEYNKRQSSSITAVKGETFEQYAQKRLAEMHSVSGGGIGAVGGAARSPIYTPGTIPSSPKALADRLKQQIPPK